MEPIAHRSHYLVYFTTIVRGAPVQQGGELVCVDWRTKEVKAKVPVLPENPPVNDPNPRGNSRGGRGCVILPDNSVLASSYHSLYRFSPDLKTKRQLSHGLLAGIHEVTLTNRQTIWVASTAVDAALEYSISDGQLELCSAFWPREMPGIQKKLGVTPLEIDKQADNRTRYLEEKFVRHPSHLHLNIVREYNGEVFALFHAFGAVANLTRDEIVLSDPELKGAHNLWFLEDRTMIINNTYKQSVQFLNMNGKIVREIKLSAFPEVRRLVTLSQRALYLLRGAWNRLNIKYLSNPLPYFVRGMAVKDGSIFIGISPATILQFNLETGQLMDLFNYSHDLASCIHGIAVATSPS